MEKSLGNWLNPFRKVIRSTVHLQLYMFYGEDGVPRLLVQTGIIIIAFINTQSF